MTTSTHTPKRTSLAIAATAAVIAAAGAGGWLYIQRASAADQPQAKETPPVAVTLARVQERDVPLYLTGVGTTMTISHTPATRAGIAFISTDDG